MMIAKSAAVIAYLVIAGVVTLGGWLTWREVREGLIEEGIGIERARQIEETRKLNAELATVNPEIVSALSASGADRAARVRDVIDGLTKTVEVPGPERIVEVQGPERVKTVVKRVSGKDCGVASEILGKLNQIN